MKATTPAFRRTSTILSLTTIALLITGTMLYAGPLDPPAGPVTSTYKTLNDVEPRTAINAANTPGDADSLFKITTPGSYYLTGNIAGVVGKHGIEIAASGVTLDLMGFDLAGAANFGSLDGVSATVSGLSNIAVVNGSVRNWGDVGIDLWTFEVLVGRVEGLRARGNLRFGIGVGSACTISNCSAYQNGASGIITKVGCALFNCSAYNNITSFGDGITTGNGCTLSNCSARGNAGNGIFTGDACTLTNCTVSDTTGSGIYTRDACTLSNCSASETLGNGITTGTSSTLTNCLAFRNTILGIATGDGSTISNCSAFNNAGNGVSAGTACTVLNCTVSFNLGIGISAFSANTIADCTILQSTLDGIRCTSQSIIRGNMCTGNGSGGDGAGIYAIGADNRIEGNNCTLADRGIYVDSPGNIIIKNSCSGNTTNWEVVANNTVGPILDRIAPASPAILGNSAPDSTGSTHPNANFTY